MSWINDTPLAQSLQIYCLRGVTGSCNDNVVVAGISRDVVGWLIDTSPNDQMDCVIAPGLGRAVVAAGSTIETSSHADADVVAGLGRAVVAAGSLIALWTNDAAD